MTRPLKHSDVAQRTDYRFYTDFLIQLEVT